MLSRNPQAKQAFVFKLPGFRELSMATPNWFKRCQKGMDAINRDTHRFFHKLGVENLFHPDPTVREAATFVAQIAEKNGSDAFDVTPKLRAAVRTLADPSSGAFQRFQRREEKDRFLKETGFGNQLTALARQKLASGAASASPLVELDAVVSAFHPALPHELQERYDAMRQGRVRWSRELDAAVTAYARQTYGGENPFEARSSAGQPVSDLLTFITTGGTEKLAKGGAFDPSLERIRWHHIRHSHRGASPPAVEYALPRPRAARGSQPVHEAVQRTRERGAVRAR